MNDLVPMDQLDRMAAAFSASGFGGQKSKDQVLALLLLASAEGVHPAIAFRDFDVINGKPAKKAEAMHRSFLAAGGKVEWHTLDDTKADATFSHPQGGSARIIWDMERVKKAKIANEAMYTKYPRAMLRSRCISEGCRTVYPAATSGMYEPGEAAGIPEKDMGRALVVVPPLREVLDAISKMTTKGERDNAKAMAALLDDSDQIAMAEAAWAQRIEELKNPNQGADRYAFKKDATEGQV